MYAIRQMTDEDKELRQSEGEWHRWRMSYTLLANIYRDTKKRPNPYLPTDLIKLSFDDEVQRDTYVPPSPDFIEHLKKRFGSTIKKKDV